MPSVIEFTVTKTVEVLCTIEKRICSCGEYEIVLAKQREDWIVLTLKSVGPKGNGDTQNLSFELSPKGIISSEGTSGTWYLIPSIDSNIRMLVRE